MVETNMYMKGDLEKVGGNEENFPTSCSAPQISRKLAKENKKI
jgi:hypothetical protein